MYKLFDITATLPINVLSVTTRKTWIAELGKTLRQMRDARGVSQQALAEKIGKTRCTIINYETGKEAPSLEVLGKICECLGSATFLVDKQRFQIGMDAGARKPTAVPKQLRLRLGIVCAANQVRILPSKRKNRLDVEVLSA
jgi:transcriptional regulator with XRE-family HTH domain